MSLRHHTSGNARPWEHRPSDHRRTCAYRKFVDGPIRPMQEPGWFTRLFHKG